MSYAPVEICIRFPAAGGQRLVETYPIVVKVETDYPHKDSVKIAVDNPGSAQFKLKLRIPQWADGAVISVDGAKQELSGGGYFHEVSISDTVTEIVLKFDFSVVVNYRGQYFSVQRGPIIFALPITAEWKRIHADWPTRELPHADWELFAKSKWNYTLEAVDNACLEQSAFAEAFSSAVSTQKLTVQAREIINWHAKDGCHADLPEELELGEMATVTLIPYAQAKLRITEFPRVPRK